MKGARVALPGHRAACSSKFGSARFARSSARRIFSARMAAHASDCHCAGVRYAHVLFLRCSPRELAAKRALWRREFLLHGVSARSCCCNASKRGGTASPPAGPELDPGRPDWPLPTMPQSPKNVELFHGTFPVRASSSTPISARASSLARPVSRPPRLPAELRSSNLNFVSISRKSTDPDPSVSNAAKSVRASSSDSDTCASDSKPRFISSSDTWLSAFLSMLRKQDPGPSSGNA